MTTSLFKPMLAAKPDPDEIDEAIAKLSFPAMFSPKLDGIRCMVQNGRLYSRSLKLIPNEEMQRKWGKVALNGVDGELVVGLPTAEDCFNRTTSIVMSRDKPMGEAKFCVFDKYHATNPFVQRHNEMKALDKYDINVVPHTTLGSWEALGEYEALQIERGYEGVMRRDPAGLYKQGRSTLKEGGLVAIKRTVDAEAIVLDTYEQMENTNEKKENELGRMKRSSHKAGKVGKGTLGGFVVTMFTVCGLGLNAVLHEEYGVKFNIGTGQGLTDAVRLGLWRKRESLVGKIVKFRYQKVGTMEAPRQPIFLGFRDPSDL